MLIESLIFGVNKCFNQLGRDFLKFNRDSVFSIILANNLVVGADNQGCFVLIGIANAPQSRRFTKQPQEVDVDEEQKNQEQYCSGNDYVDQPGIPRQGFKTSQPFFSPFNELKPPFSDEFPNYRRFFLQKSSKIPEQRYQFIPHIVGKNLAAKLMEKI